MSSPTQFISDSFIVKSLHFAFIKNLYIKVYYIIQKVKKMMQKVEVFGEVPLARFGHTITQGNRPSPL